MHTTCSVCICYLSVCFQADNLVLDHQLVQLPGEDCFSSGWTLLTVPSGREWGLIKDIWIKAKFVRLNKEAEVRGRLLFLFGSGLGCGTKINGRLCHSGLNLHVAAAAHLPRDSGAGWP